MNIDLKKSSIVQWYEGRKKQRCGYCKTENSISQGMWAETLNVEDYQELIDRGWRRSGKYCYKSAMEETCCPLYTIKCDAIHFSLSKSQKKVIKKFNTFLKNGEIKSEDNTSFEDSESCSEFPQKHPKINLSVINASISNSIKEGSLEEPSSSTSNQPSHKVNENCEQKIEQACDKVTDSSQVKLNIKTSIKSGVGADPNKPPSKKAKLLRIEKKKMKGLEFQKSPCVSNQKSLEQFLEEVSENDKNRLKITMERMSHSCSTFTLSAELYKRYQIRIHNDDPNECSEDQFFEFLVETPLQPRNFPEELDVPGYGTFHQQYWLNDRLIAVGVIDILPRCVSSVYFFYDPDYRSLTLGTYGSLREVELTRQLQTKLPDLSSYYMGFYIHTCPKMRYKGKLTPSYLACPETYDWIPIEKCISLLEANRYSRLNDDIDAIDINLPTERDILQIKVVCERTLMTYADYKELVGESEKFKNIGNLIGARCCKTLIFWER